MKRAQLEEFFKKRIFELETVLKKMTQEKWYNYQARMNFIQGSLNLNRELLKWLFPSILA